MDSQGRAVCGNSRQINFYIFSTSVVEALTATDCWRYALEERLSHRCMRATDAIPIVFLSHNSADKPFVRRLAAELEKRGISCWVDEAEIHYGESLVQKISNAIERIVLVLAVISNNSVDSSWVRQELEWAMTKEIKQRRVVIIPLLVGKCDIPFFLMNKLYADFTDESRFLETVNRLVASILHHQGQTQQGTPHTSFGVRVSLPYRPTLLPLAMDILLLAFSVSLFVFPSFSMMYPMDPRRNELVCAAMRGFGLLMGAAVLMDIARIVLTRYMMRGNANFARAAADLRWSGCLSGKFRRLVRQYWQYPLVKVLVFIEAGTSVAILLMLWCAIRIGVAILK